jgi:hypothetical protein
MSPLVVVQAADANANVAARAAEASNRAARAGGMDIRPSNKTLTLTTG